MPYRRLPNTDAARIRAMRTALAMGKELPPLQLAYSPKSIIRLEHFLPQFEHNIQLYRNAMSSLNKKSRDYNDAARKARIYISHFIRVMNMAIYRGEILAETRAFYGLATNNSSVPPMSTENELLSWGRRILEGEESRIKKGGSPITNPTIAVVKVRFGNFLDALNQNQNQGQKMSEYSEKIRSLRSEADKIIASVWNEVEQSYQSSHEQDKKEKCEKYGLVYFYRKNELEKMKVPESPVEESNVKNQLHTDPSILES
jgi:hypothetical protein